jgi:hypothetical protein
MLDLNDLSIEKAHAEYSASGSSRWLGCPGAIAKAKNYPPLPESKYATEGTDAHACFEFVIKNFRNKQAIKEATKKWGKEMVRHAVDAAIFLLAKQRELGAILEVEVKVDASPFICEGQFGTADTILYAMFDTLVVADYKYGAGIPVDVREPDGKLNSQLAYYALAAAFKYQFQFERVELVVIQPRARHESGETIRTTEVSVDELKSWIGKFKDGYKETLKPDAPLRSGKWCRFCPAAIDCPELKDKSLKQAQIAFSGNNALLPPMSAVTPELGTVLDACEKIEEWISKVRAHAIDQLAKGHEITGWKLVEKRGTRKWIDESETEADAQLLLGELAFTEPTLKSPAQIEAAFGKSIKPWVAERTFKEVTGTTLVKDTDKRQPVNVLETVFSIIED